MLDNFKNGGVVCCSGFFEGFFKGQILHIGNQVPMGRNISGFKRGTFKPLRGKGKRN